MKVLLKESLLVLIAETEEERQQVSAWRSRHDQHVLHVRGGDAPGGDDGAGRSLVLDDLGLKEEACREPINVVSTSSDPVARIISNLADTPFDMDGQRYASVESFWQGLKFERGGDRRRIAEMGGPQARAEGTRQGYGERIMFEGRQIIPGTWEHWQLMEMACRAKFAQVPQARQALLATGERPLLHIVRRDSRTIPGVVMAAIWMRIRKGLAGEAAGARSGRPSSRER